MASKSLLWLLLGLTLSAGAEPWLGTRFAQNCSGCHAPGRRQLAPVDRRCTLSCQGCHVSPNGGGLRSFYGKWTENHWLKTFRVKSVHKIRTTAPLNRQRYYMSVKKYLKGGAQSRISRAKKAIRTGYPIVSSKMEKPPESLFDRVGDPYFDKLPAVRQRREFLFTLPIEDPYREFTRRKVDGGASVRLAALKRLGENDDKDLKPFLMSGEFGLRWRPYYRNLHFVYESRFFGSPQGPPLENTLNDYSTRSLYVMIDNLPYNIFVMGGYYRPLFGNYVADHYALNQMLTGTVLNNSSPLRLQYRAISIGTAPNVPYANFHIIDKNIAKGAGDKTQGFAANLGMRFVSFGASANYSVWSTTDKTDPANPIKVVMHSVNFLGAIFSGRLIFGLDATSFERNNPAVDFRRGGVVTFESKLRVWREFYLTGDYAFANTNTSLLPGSTTQTKFGFKVFLFPGWEYSLFLNTDTITTSATDTGESQVTIRKYLFANIHLYY